MELEVNKSSNNGTQWAIIIIIIIVFLLVVWIVSQYIQNKSVDNKSFFSKFKKDEKKVAVDQKQVIEYLKSNSVEKSKINEKQVEQQDLNQFKANVLAAHNVLLNYVNTINGTAQQILNNPNLKISSKKVQNYQNDVQKVLDTLKDIETKLGELNQVPVEDTKKVKKYVKYLKQQVKSAYSKLDQVQYDQNYFFEELYSYSLANNLSQEEYLALVQPVFNILKFEYDTHQGLNVSVNTDLQCSYENVVNEITKKRNKVPVSRTQATEEYYLKLYRNFSNWWKNNIDNF